MRRKCSGKKYAELEFKRDVSAPGLAEVGHSTAKAWKDAQEELRLVKHWTQSFAKQLGSSNLINDCRNIFKKESPT